MALALLTRGRWGDARVEAAEVEEEEGRRLCRMIGEATLAWR